VITKMTMKLVFKICLAFLCFNITKGMKCYTCGLEEFDPDLDKRGTYNITVVPGVNKGYKMYNHTCWEMDNLKGQNVPFMFTRDLLLNEMATVEEADEVVTHMKTINSNWNLEKGFLIYQNDYENIQGLLINAKKPGIPDWKLWESRATEYYDIDMWIRECGPGVQHCYQAEGDYDSQLPTFRGCAGTEYIYDNQCFHESQAVTVSLTPKRSVDVGVTLCYCGSELCNTELNGAPRFLLSAIMIPALMISKWML